MHLGARAGLVLLSGCASAQGGAGHDGRARESISVPIGARGLDAVAVVQEAVTRGGWRVSAASPDLVTVATVSHREHPRVRLVLYASIVGDSAIVRGTLTDPMRGLRDHPIRSGTSGGAGWGWRELSRFADALRPRPGTDRGVTKKRTR